MRIIFCATGDIAISSFNELIKSGHEISLLLTQPDKPVGRKRLLTAPKVKELALENGIEVYQPEKIRSEESVELLTALQPDVIVVIAYGQILSQEVLDIPSVACINVHASLLPKYRGASCIQSAIKNGDTETGVTIMHMSKGLDEGDIILAKKVKIQANDTAGTLHDKLAAAAPQALSEALELLRRNAAQRITQDSSNSCYSPKLLRDDGEIVWAALAEQIELLIRAYDPWPATYTTIEHNGSLKRLKIFPLVHVIDEQGAIGEILSVTADSVTIGCKQDAIRISGELQLEGGKRMAVRQLINSGVFQAGKYLGQGNSKS